MFFRRSYIAIAALALICSCGGSGDGGLNIPDDVPTGTVPLVTEVSPTSGPVGTDVTITGIGYSYIPPNNTIMIGDVSVVASAQAYLPDPTSTSFETLTFTVPDDAPVGDNSIVVIVGDNASNADVIFTVTP